MKQSIIKFCLFSGLVAAMQIAAFDTYAGHPMDDDANHPKIIIPSSKAIPRLALEIFEDDISGYNLHLKLENYLMKPPQEASLENDPKALLEGHAHLFINGKKIQRLYGKNTHLPMSLFTAGINQIMVSLNDHYHQTWTAEDNEIYANLIINTLKKPIVQSHYSNAK